MLKGFRSPFGLVSLQVKATPNKKTQSSRVCIKDINCGHKHLARASPNAAPDNMCPTSQKVNNFSQQTSKFRGALDLDMVLKRPGKEMSTNASLRFVPHLGFERKQRSQKCGFFFFSNSLLDGGIMTPPFYCKLFPGQINVVLYLLIGLRILVRGRPTMEWGRFQL